MRLKVLAPACLAAIGAGGLSVAHAQVDDSDSIAFAGLTITDTCTILLPLPGTLAVSADGTEISSENATSGSADIVTTSGNYEVSVIPPADFDAPTPAGAATGTTFGASVRTLGGGATAAFDIVNGATQLLGFGTTPVLVDFEASRDEVYEAGVYAATVTLQCVAAP